jgi:XTP/dITP diphosphohydrolase
VRLVLASANPDKAVEIRALFVGTGIEVVPVSEVATGWEVDESGATLAENARLKAEAAVRATGSPAIADDSGLFVDALGGAPGVHSSRYAGRDATYADNVRKLLAALEGVPPTRRTARFRTVALVATLDGREAEFEGTLEGTILTVPRGDRGFGYDPVFFAPELGRGLAEVELDEKNRVSHRARAFRRAARFLEAHPVWLERPERTVAEGGPRR